LFDHQSFTGRSGTFYKYEGLGCIYWHMVSKLLLAVQENYYRAVQVEKDKSKLRELRKHYYDIRGGLGLAKSAGEYGGFPTDPYSHTPGHSGAQQPGMTGQVKEDIISRFGELGVRVHDGGITFWPGLLRREEFLDNPVIFSYYNTRNEPESIWLSAKCLAFTVAQVPVIYHLAAVEKIMITIHSGKIETLTGLSLDQDLSLSVFNRSGEIKRLDVYLKL